MCNQTLGRALSKRLPLLWYFFVKLFFGIFFLLVICSACINVAGGLNMISVCLSLGGRIFHLSLTQIQHLLLKNG